MWILTPQAHPFEQYEDSKAIANEAQLLFEAISDPQNPGLSGSAWKQKTRDVMHRIRTDPQNESTRKVRKIQNLIFSAAYDRRTDPLTEALELLDTTRAVLSFLKVQLGWSNQDIGFEHQMKQIMVLTWALLVNLLSSERGVSLSWVNFPDDGVSTDPPTFTRLSWTHWGEIFGDTQCSNAIPEPNAEAQVQILDNVDSRLSSEAKDHRRRRKS